MALIDDLASIDKVMEELATAAREIEERDLTINAQIASLRLELANLRDKRYQVKQRTKTVQLDRESVARKLDLENEALSIQLTLEQKRVAAMELLKDAPWFDPEFKKPNTAFKWQIDGALMLPERALLGDKRGLGKTLSSLIWRRIQGSKKTLICLRKEVASDFIKEISIREPGLFVYPLLGANPETRGIAAMLLNAQKEFVVVTNIESWRRDIERTTDDILKIDYDAVILDEAHHIKNAGTGTAKGFFKLVSKIPKVLELTGTPIKNRPQEMFSLLHALYPELFPRENKFLWDYCIQVGQNKWSFTPQGVTNLVKQISSFYVARTPEDIGRQVPPPRMIEYKLSLENHLEQQAAYRDMAERSMAIINSEKAVPIVSQLAVMTRLSQTVSWPCPIHFRDPETEEIFTLEVPQSVKADWAEEFIQELVEEGERVILFSRFKPAIYELKSRLEGHGLSVAVITGDEKAKGNTQDVFNDFDLKTAPKTPKYQVLLATYQTVGESANLNASRHMILFDRYWNPGNDDQAIGRIDRINSIDQATVHLPYVEGTIDEYMIKLIDDKRNIVTDFKDAASQQAALFKHLESTVR